MPLAPQRPQQACLTLRAGCCACEECTGHGCMKCRGFGPTWPGTRSRTAASTAPGCRCRCCCRRRCRCRYCCCSAAAGARRTRCTGPRRRTCRRRSPVCGVRFRVIPRHYPNSAQGAATHSKPQHCKAHASTPWSSALSCLAAHPFSFCSQSAVDWCSAPSVPIHSQPSGTQHPQKGSQGHVRVRSKDGGRDDL